LRELWAADLNGQVSYPLIAGGHIYVTVANGAQGDSSHYGSKLYAFSERTGAVAWGPIELSGAYGLSSLAYDAGRVFVHTFDGPLRSFDALTGTLVWSVQLPMEYTFDAPPTAVGGVVYTSGTGNAGEVYAVSEDNGSVLWMTRVMNGSFSSPVVSDNAVFVAYACEHDYALDPRSGSVIWSTNSGCEGGGGSTAAYSQGRLYVRDPGGACGYYQCGDLVYDAGNGKVVGQFTGKVMPALDGASGYFLDGSALRARDLNTNATRWTFDGDGTLDSPPVVMNGYVYIASSQGMLYGLRAGDGQRVWAANLGSGFISPSELSTEPMPDIGAGDNLVVVPANHRLVVYGS
jgi:outer membrane protein assembly factor BamB